MTKRYGLEQTFSYEEFDDCLREVDAVYIALPNSMHADYTIRAARAGVHVLCEKPMAVTTKECQQIVRIVEALYQSARSGRPVTIRRFVKTRRPTGRQRITRPGVRKPRLIKVQSASRD
jgi:predicted dehydrogenase